MWCMHGGISRPVLSPVGFIGVLYTMFVWWRTSSRKPYGGDHTRSCRCTSLRHDPVHRLRGDVLRRLVLGLLRRRAVPPTTHQFARTTFTGGVWPPKGIETFDPWHLPLLNTLILLTSGTTVTWAHHALLESDRQGLKWGLLLHHLLGLLFTCVQAYEYSHAAFRLQGQHLRRDLLHGDRLPRVPRHHRHDLPDRLPRSAPISATSRRTSISASSSPPGTGTSSTWSGCSCSPASTSGAWRRRPPPRHASARSSLEDGRPRGSAPCRAVAFRGSPDERSVITRRNRPSRRAGRSLPPLRQGARLFEGF